MEIDENVSVQILKQNEIVAALLTIASIVGNTKPEIVYFDYIENLRRVRKHELDVMLHQLKMEQESQQE